LGEHTAELLAEIGYSRTQTAALVSPAKSEPPE
jgi:crotonobetainyl-CoA:carnitine CoA-transferase CaiB-like acyl-CoA transferase